MAAASPQTESMITLESPARLARKLTPKEAALRMLHDLATGADVPAY